MPENQPTNRVRTLPELTQDNNTLRNKLVYQLNVDNNQILAKTILQNTVDAMNNNTKAFKELAKAEQQKRDDLTEEQKQYPTSAEFDVIAQHIEDFTKEAANSSIFERADKLRIMKYIETAIKNANIDEKEKKQLIDQYFLASRSIQNVTGVFDKASALFTRTIINFTSFMGSIFSDLPPVWGWMLAKGGDALSNMLERRRTRQERTASLEYDIDTEKNNRSLEFLKSQDSKEDREDAKKEAEEKTAQPVSKFAESKMERIQGASGSLLDKAPTGSESDPFFVKLADNSLFQKEDKKKNPLLAALAGLLSGFAGKITAAIGSLAAALGLAKDAKAAGTAAKAAKDLLGKDKSKPEVPDKDKGKNSKVQRTNKPSKLGKAASLAGKVLGPVAAAAGVGALLAEGTKLSAEEYDKANETLKKHGLKPIEIDTDDTFASLERLKEQDLKTGKFEQKKNPEDGVVNESKDTSRASVGTQVDAATKARITANEEKRAQEIQLNQSNNSTVINNYNKTTNQNTARVVQVTNPQAGLVNGSR